MRMGDVVIYEGAAPGAPRCPEFGIGIINFVDCTGVQVIISKNENTKWWFVEHQLTVIDHIEEEE